MEITVYTPQKGRLETIDAEITNENTTWFDACHNEDMIMITDYQGCLLIRRVIEMCQEVLVGQSNTCHSKVIRKLAVVPPRNTGPC